MAKEFLLKQITNCKANREKLTLFSWSADERVCVVIFQTASKFSQVPVCASRWKQTEILRDSKIAALYAVTKPSSYYIRTPNALISPNDMSAVPRPMRRGRSLPRMD